MEYQFVHGQCLSRSCDQSVTGRNLMYSRALQIIQSEEYLDEADLDVIRRADIESPQYYYQGKCFSSFNRYCLDAAVIPYNSRRNLL